MPIEGTRRTKLGSSTQPEPPSAEVKTNMADIADDIEGVPDRELLLQILSNQKSAAENSDEQFTKLSKQVKDAKSALDSYKV